MDECKYYCKLPRNMDEHRFAVSDVELSQSSYKKGTRRVALRDIASVRLTRVQGRTYCTVKAAGVPQTVVPSPALIGGLNTPEARAQYRTFIQCLHEKIAASGARPAFIGGSNLLFVLGAISFVLLGVSIAAYLVGLAVLGKSVPQLLFASVLLAISGIPLLKKGKAAPYSPQAIPERYLSDD